MNANLYKIIFSKVRNAYVVVSDCASSISSPGRPARADVLQNAVVQVSLGLSLSFTLMASAFAAPALPQGGTVSRGAAVISQSGNVMTVNQSTDKAVVNWQSFSIGTDAKVNIVQPSASSTHLSRVTGNDPSVIQGQLNSNGQVVLVNPNGIVVGKDGSVSASSFTASTLNITDDDFMAGKYQYARKGANGEVVNQGKIETKAGGYVALLGAKVTNEGTITSQQGAVYLGAGDAVAVPVTGSGRIKFEVSPAAINTSVANNKDAVIVAEGGQVYMRAASLNDLAVASVQQSGIVDVSGEQGGNVTVLADKGKIKVDGTIKANSTVAAKGGYIVMGHDVETGVLAAQGDYSGAKLEAAKGFVETSGSWISTTGTRVQAAEWLLDPVNITISGGPESGDPYSIPGSYEPGQDSVILASDISKNLNAGTNITITTGLAGSTGTSDGNIIVDQAIEKSGANNATLTLIANNSITVNARIGRISTDTTSTGMLNIDLQASGLSALKTISRGIILNNVLDASGGVVTLTGVSYNTLGFNSTIENSINSGVVFNTASGINASSFTVNGTSNTNGFYNVSGVAFLGTGIVLQSTGASSVTGWSNSQIGGNFGPGVFFASRSSTLIDSGAGSILIAGEHSAVGTNGVRIGTEAETPRAAINTKGDVTISSQNSSGLYRGMMSFRSGEIKVESGALTFSGEKVDFFDFTANLDIFNNATFNIDATSDVTLSKEWSSGRLAVTSGGTGVININSTNGVIEAYRNITAEKGNLNLSAPTILLKTLTDKELNATNPPPPYNRSFNARQINVTTNHLEIYPTFKLNAVMYAVSNGLTVKTLDPTVGIRLGANDSAGWLGLSQAELNNLTSYNSYIGTANQASAIEVVQDIITPQSAGAITFSTLSDIAINSNLTIGDSGFLKNLTLQAMGSASQVTQTGAITASGLALLGSNASFTLENSGNTFSTLAGNVKTASIFDKSSLTVGTIGSTVGFVANDTIKIVSDSSIRVSQKIETLNTGTNAIFLNAGASTSAGTASGGDITVDPSVLIKAGNNARITLMTGSISGSTGLGILPGNYRYGSDETTSNYSQPLGIGRYAIYRESPSVRLVFNDGGKIYDGTAFTGNYGYQVTTADLKNGDTSPLISGTLVSEGTAQSSVNAGSYTLTGSGLKSDLGYALSYVAGTYSIDKKSLTTTFQANSKEYDGLVDATGTLEFVGLIPGETLIPTVSSISFLDKNVGTNKTVTASGISFGTSSVGLNYQLAPGEETKNSTATISQRLLTYTGVNISNKIYDATTSAAFATAGVLGNTVSGDDVSIAPIANFSDANVGNGKTVTLTNMVLSGADAANYTLLSGGVGPVVTYTADITPLMLSVSGVTAKDKVYDATNLATIDSSLASLVGVLSADSGSVSLDTSALVGAFEDKNVGVANVVGVSGFALSGTNSVNYAFPTAYRSTTSASITPAPLSVSGISALNKVADGTTTATLDFGGVSWIGLVGSDQFSVTGTGRFDSPEAGVNKTVWLTLDVSGLGLANYVVTTQQQAKATIFMKKEEGGSQVPNEVVDNRPSKIDFVSPTQRMLAELNLNQPSLVSQGSMIESSSAEIVFTLANETTLVNDCRLEPEILIGEYRSCECVRLSESLPVSTEPEICYVPAVRLAAID